jgi:hypothetical protein
MHPFASAGAVMATSASAIAAHPKILFMSLTPGSETSSWSSNNAAHEKFPLMRRSSAVVAAGWLASTALGAVVGGTAGGLIGALTAAGVSKEDAHAYAEGIRRGGTLVTARVPDLDRAKSEAILNRASVNIQDRGTAYRQAGWKEFDASGTPYTADQVRRERELYR